MGTDIIDYKTGHGSMILGHSHPAIVAAVTEPDGASGTHLSGSSTDLEIQWGAVGTEADSQARRRSVSIAPAPKPS